jgi:hypothetical protein
MKLELYWHIFEKVSNIKFPQNPSSWSRVISCGQKDRRTDMGKVIVAFRNFVNAPKKLLLNRNCVFSFSLQILNKMFRILKRIQLDIVINVHRASCKVPDNPIIF